MSKIAHPVKTAGLLATSLIGIPTTARAAQPELPPAPEPSPNPSQIEPRKRAGGATKYERLLAKVQIAKPESQPPQATPRSVRRQELTQPTQPIKQPQALAIPTVEFATSSTLLTEKSQRRGQTAPTLVTTTQPANLPTATSPSNSEDRWPEFVPDRESDNDRSRDEVVLIPNTNPEIASTSISQNGTANDSPELAPLAPDSAFEETDEDFSQEFEEGNPSEETDFSSPTNDGEAVALRIPPRIGVGYTGVGFEGRDAFGRLEGFVPLRQNPGGDVTFLEGRFMLDNGGNPGSNILLGHRAYSQKDNRVYGGYIGYDTRDTSNKFFQQLGLGFESLGEVWDIRSNFYIPVGDTRQQVDVSDDLSSPVTANRFEQNLLIINVPRIKRSEAAVFSFDLEGGGRIAKLGNQGDVRLYAGPYYYSAPGGTSALGGRIRADIRPNRYLNLGLGVQTDGMFGTNILFRVGASFPTHRSKRQLNEKETVLARMGQFVDRTNSIIVDSQRERFQVERTARNPDTGQPWFFTHVTLGNAGGDGTFENPLGTVQAGLNNTRSDGNDVVYIAQGTNPGIPAFTIPEQVLVLSRGPVQNLPVTAPLISGRLAPTSTVQLPLSGSGNFPSVTDTVTLSNDTILAGFTINPPAGSSGVVGTNVSNVEIRDNVISTTGDDAAGIRLTNPSGTATITSNQISTTGNTTNATVGAANFLTNGAHGIEIDLNNASLNSAVISENTVNTTGTRAIGILTNVRDGGSLGEITISDNTVTTAGANANGILTNVLSATGGSATIGNTIISNNVVLTQGGTAAGISTVSSGANASICAAFSGNTATTNQLTSSPFSFTNSGGTFQIVDTDGMFTTTQASNTANASGGATTFDFVGGTANFTQVTSCP